MRVKTEKEKMLAGELYRSADPELIADIRRAQRLLARYNVTSEEDTDERTALLRQLLGSCGEGTVIKPVFACDYGYNIRLGRNAFVNYHCVFLDCAPIEIGNNLQMGPAVQFYTATHPLEADVRRAGLEYARAIRIGHDVWIGGAAVILPGVTIGDRSVIGAGSVVVHDLPADCIAVGNPARVVRTRDGRKEHEVEKLPTKEEHMSDVIITPKNDGPYYVKGAFKIVTEGGREIAVEGNETWLCRCGHSANKPFCDGSHKKAGFKDNLD